MNMNFIRGISFFPEHLEPDSYVRQISAICSLGHLETDHPLTFLVGENGSGKSTLLEAIAVAYGFNPKGGTRNFTFSTKDTHSVLADAIRRERGVRRPKDEFFLRAEILSLNEERLSSVPYKETECYQVMSMFLNQRELLLQRLLSDGNDEDL